MKKYAVITDEKTKACNVGLGTNEKFYKSIGMTLMDVEQAYDGVWYIEGYAPEEPQEEKDKKEVERLKAELAATDYKIIKCSEYSLNGQELPYDIAELHAQRQALRDRINELENENN